MATVEMTVVRLCTGVPLDNTYTDTLTFGSASAQQSYFAGKTKIVQNELSYQREGMFIRWAGEYDQIVDCNYLCYQNASYGNKWFYAFITKLEYNNDNDTTIYFEIDAYQTFMFDVQIKSCFVEREHVADDTVGAHLIDEGVALGDYVANSVTETNFNDWWIVVASTVDLRDSPDYEPSGGYVYGDIYSGASYYLFDADDVDFISAIISDLTANGKGDAIVGMHMIPKAIVEGGSSGGYLPSTVKGATTMSVPNLNSLDGYVPKNNKLLTYPYRCLQISNNDGNAVTLRYEFFNNNAASVAYRGVGTPNGRIVCYPQNYKGVIRNFNESISLGNYPQCTWEKNLYGNWLAAQSIRWGYQKDRWFVNAVTDTALNTASNPSPLTPLMGVANKLSEAYNIASSMAEEKEVHSIIPPAIGGSIGSGYTNVSLNKYAFTCEQKSIKYEIARSIDEYFSVFGYRVNRVKIPNITGRPSWNYVKTLSAKVIGSCPTPYIDTIKNMLNKGVTFWHGDFVGDYSRDNGSTTPPPPVGTYTLTVVNGSGSGAYEGGTKIEVKADTVTNFQYWVSRNGGSFEDAYTSTTNFIMPYNDCTIEAVYKTTPTKTRIDTIMQKYVGAVEWDETVGKFQRWYYGSYVKDAWCCTCLTYCAYEAGVSSQVPKNAAVQTLYNNMAAKGSTWEATTTGQKPEPGDVVFFITPQSTTVLHHCGVVSAISGNTVTYISGNTTNPSGGPDGVFVKTTVIGQGGTYYAKYFGKVDYS